MTVLMSRDNHWNGWPTSCAACGAPAGPFHRLANGATVGWVGVGCELVFHPACAIGVALILIKDGQLADPHWNDDSIHDQPQASS